MRVRQFEIGVALVLVGLAVFGLVAQAATTQTVWPLGKTWVDPGGTVVDNVDGAIPWTSVTVTGGPVNVAVAGTYTLTYTVADQAGNVGTATRQVTVKDQTPPVITLK